MKTKSIIKYDFYPILLGWIESLVAFFNNVEPIDHILRPFQACLAVL